MKTFITGATGYIGSKLALQCAEQGDTVHALCRNAEKSRKLAHPDIVVFAGELLDRNAVRDAMKDCSHVYHVAALASVWEPDSTAYHKVNVEGTQVVLEAALHLGVKRVVFTSTAGVLGPSFGEPITETQERRIPLISEYDRTKDEAERMVATYVDRGLEVVTVNPTRVYGPSICNPTKNVNGLIRMYLDGSWRFLPGDGRKLGNYVHIDDVIRGHLLAMDKGRSGERYLLAGDDLSYREFFNLIGEAGGKVRRLIPAPMPVMLAFARAQMFKTLLTGTAPRLTPSWVRRFGYDYVVSSDKARQDLGYTTVPARKGITETVAWLQKLQEESGSAR